MAASNRKDKGLGSLSSRFVSLYNDGHSVVLDDAARRLGVERRRIYDVVNILESVGMVAKKGKHTYIWIGLSGIPNALDEIKKTEILIEEANQKVVDGDDAREVKSEKLVEAKQILPQNESTVNALSALGDRKEMSLGSLTQKFIGVFLTITAESVSLEEAARLLLKDGHKSSKFRRLYEVANVLCAINLIQKITQHDTRKPAYRWLGTRGPEANLVTPPAEQSHKRPFGTDITNVDKKKVKVDFNFGPFSPANLRSLGFLKSP